MKITLTEHEIRRALQVYCAAKTGRDARDCDVVLHKRARNGVLYATVDIGKVPTLTRVVKVDA